MNSLIIATVARFMLPLLILFSLFLLYRGHNEPGGGFAGGLVAAAAYALYSLAFGVQRARRVLHVDPRRLVAVGLLIALISGLLGLFWGVPYLTSQWITKGLGTPLFFDLGVYLVVGGMALTILFALGEEQ